MRALYNVLWRLALPWAFVRLWWRGRAEPGYRTHVAQRFGHFDLDLLPPVLWVHAVSLGETNAARPLIERLRTRFPGATILLTHMTATGRAAGRSMGEDVVQCWLPYDVPRYVSAFLDRVRPAAGMLMETEVWPNLVAEAKRRGIPLFLVNARLSARSAAGYARFGAFAHATFAAFAGIAAQTSDDAKRLAALGAPSPVVTGNLKFDVGMKPDALARGASLRDLFGQARPVWLAASTRDGEEALILDAMRAASFPVDTLLVLVPRHPQRFDAVATLLRERGLSFVRRSESALATAETAVVLGDTMGEMDAYCLAADVVLVGGGLLPLGGQNLIEPIAAGKPTVVGPHMFNFAAATTAAVAAGAARQAADANEAVATVATLLRDPAAREAMARAAAAFHSTHTGATDRLWGWLAPQLERALQGTASRLNR